MQVFESTVWDYPSWQSALAHPWLIQSICERLHSFSSWLHVGGWTRGTWVPENVFRRQSFGFKSMGLLLALGLKTYVGVFPEQFLGFDLDQASNGFWGAPVKAPENIGARSSTVSCLLRSGVGVIEWWDVALAAEGFQFLQARSLWKNDSLRRLNHPEVNTAKSGICILYYFVGCYPSDWSDSVQRLNVLNLMADLRNLQSPPERSGCSFGS